MGPSVIEQKAQVALQSSIYGKQQSVVGRGRAVIHRIYCREGGSSGWIEQGQDPSVIRVCNRRTRARSAGSRNVDGWIRLDSRPNVRTFIPNVISRNQPVCAQLLLDAGVPFLVVG